MFFRPRRNRRRVDLARKTGEMKAVAAHAMPLVLRVAASIGLSAALAWGGFEGWRWARTTPTFALRTVTFSGNARATDAELGRLGALGPTVNLVALDTAALERALAAHPWVKEVRVRRFLPSRLAVEVTEHEPAAVAALGDLYLVDVAGEPFKRLLPGDGLDLPLITGVEREDVVQHREAALSRLAAAVEVVRTYARSPAGQGHPPSEVHLGDDGLTVVTVDGQELRFGDGALGARLERLAVVRRELAKRALTAAVIRLDDRARPDRVTVQLEPATPERGARAVK